MEKEKQVKKTNKNQTAYVHVPKDGLNDYEETIEVSINGKVWTIARGVLVEVPLDVAQVLYEAKRINDYQIKA